MRLVRLYIACVGVYALHDDAGSSPPRGFALGDLHFEQLRAMGVINSFFTASHPRVHRPLAVKITEQRRRIELENDLYSILNSPPRSPSFPRVHLFDPAYDSMRLLRHIASDFSGHVRKSADAPEESLLQDVMSRSLLLRNDLYSYTRLQHLFNRTNVSVLVSDVMTRSQYPDAVANVTNFARFVRAILRGLAHAHSRGVVLGDLGVRNNLFWDDAAGIVSFPDVNNGRSGQQHFRSDLTDVGASLEKRLASGCRCFSGSEMVQYRRLMRPHKWVAEKGDSSEQFAAYRAHLAAFSDARGWNSTVSLIQTMADGHPLGHPLKSLDVVDLLEHPLFSLWPI